MTDEQARDCIERRLGRALDELVRYPTFVDLDTINQCNARCVMCGIDFSKRQRQTMPPALFEKIVADLAGHTDTVERVGLEVNCEPLLDPMLEDKIARLKEVGIQQTYISTNGSLLSPERSRRLLEAGLDVIYISIDSLRAETFERIRRGLFFDEVYRNTLEFIRLKQEIRPSGTLRIFMVLQQANRDEADSFAEHWQSILVSGDEVVVSRAYNWGRAQGVALPAENSVIDTSPCIALWSSLVIAVNGDVHLCCCDADGEIVLGNLGEQSIADIWGGAKLQAIREQHLSGQRDSLRLCANCTVWHDEKHVIQRRVEGQKTVDGRRWTEK
jgi:radical SAM protein with 4Fe4S-binding SPASM domain